MPRDEDPPRPQEWRVTLLDDDEVTIPAKLGGVDVGIMPVTDSLHFLVISDANNRAVWMHRADTVRKVTRCVEPSQS